LPEDHEAEHEDEQCHPSHESLPFQYRLWLSFSGFYEYHETCSIGGSRISQVLGDGVQKLSQEPNMTPEKPSQKALPNGADGEKEKSPSNRESNETRLRKNT
jgi:hypothetical protein